MSIAVGLSWYAEARRECEALQAEIDRLRGDAEVSRLRLEAAHSEIERLRALADKRGTIAVNRRREIERLRITPEERKAIEGLMMGGCEPPQEVLEAEIDAVRGFLARHDAIGHQDCHG